MRNAGEQRGTKFIFVTGGVTSSVGKGGTAASLGRLLKLRGLKVGMQKFDAYYNINTGLMSPLQHGEVYVTADGGECDLDIGSYERFIDVDLRRDSDITSGKIYQAVIEKERQGDYNGGTVQVIPHVTDEIKKTLYRCARSNEAEVLITEIGGTVGDIETQPFLEACRQMRQEVGAENCMFIHVALVPYLEAAGEMKTKPTQHSVRQLRGFGIQPDCIVCRGEYPVDESLKAKIALFCNVSPSSVISNVDVDPIYELPEYLQKEGLDELVLKRLGIDASPLPEKDNWHDLLARYREANECVRIALVGKYVDLQDAYLSVTEALTHAGIARACRVDIEWVYSGDITSDEDAQRFLGSVDGIVAPGGFGERGMEGLIRTAHFARENRVPFLGIGLGMQMALVDFARSVCKLDADSTEANPRTANPVLAMMEDYKEDGSMRLGNDRIALQEGSRVRELYGTDEILERHRNRYEINPDFENVLSEAGLVFGGRSVALKLAASIELPLSLHPYFIGTIYHAEFSTRLERPHPLFVGLFDAAYAQKEEK